MYPLLLEFSDEFNRKTDNPVCFAVENIKNAAVKNGEFSGENIKTALKAFGKDCFGKNGINTLFFRFPERLKPITDRISPYLEQTDTTIYPFGVANNIITDENITADHLFLNGRAGICEDKSFLIIFVLEHDLLLSDFDSTMKVKKGEAVFVPAKDRVELTGEAEIILIHL